MTSSSDHNLILTSRDVAYLITQRESLDKRLILSVKGTVTALSEINIKVKNYYIFLIELDKCIVILAKDNLAWHSELVPGNVFVFHNLKLTTLVQGISNPCSVLLDSKTSSLSKQTFGNSVTPASLQEWLKMENISSILPEATMQHHEADLDENNELVHYEGIVTSAEQSHIGELTLDDKISVLSVFDKVNHIKKLTRVHIYNAHLIKECCKTYLVCCRKSCIQIQTKVSVHDEVEETVDNLRAFMKKVIERYGLNLRETVAIFSLYYALARINRLSSYQKKLLIGFIENYVGNNFVHHSFTATDIFIHHDSHCPFSHDQSDVSRIPQVLDLCNLKSQIAKMLSNCNASSNESDDFKKIFTESGMQLQASSGDCTLSSCNGKILVGYIRSSSKGIHVETNTSTIAVILPESDTIDSDNHRCGSSGDECLRPEIVKSNYDSHCHPHPCCQHCFCQPQQWKRLVCPVLDPWLVRKNICVTKFQLVVDSCQRSMRTEDSDPLVYLAFSLLDCILLDKVDDSSFSSTAFSSSASSSSSSSLSHIIPPGLSGQGKVTCIRKCDNESKFWIYVSEKQPLIHTNSHQGTKTCHFIVVGSMMDPDLVTEKLLTESHTHVANRTISKVTVSENIAPNQESFSNADSCVQAVCALFPNALSNLYNCISEGHLYKLTSRSTCKWDPLGAKGAKFSKVGLHKVAEQCKTRMFINMPEDLIIKRIPATYCGTDNCFRDVHLMHPISQIMSERFAETIVSFQGVIVSRDFTESMFSDNYRIGQMDNIKLRVRESAPSGATNSPSVIAVYLNTPHRGHIIGLVTGAVVKFHRVERKVSKKDMVYCKFISISVAEVVKFLPQWDISSPNTLKPRELLFNLMLKDKKEDCQRESQEFIIHCHIDKIFKLSVRMFCSSCKSTYLKQSCQGRGCNTTKPPIPVATATLLVEDGTSSATVKVWSSDLVRQLLTLTSTQWEEVFGTALEIGELLIDYATSFSTSPSSAVAIFLHSLIGSPMVLRTCKMAVKRSKGSELVNIDKILLNDFQENVVKIGKHSVKTLSFPRIQLDCLAISEID